jgi:hypothetical protein
MGLHDDRKDRDEPTAPSRRREAGSAAPGTRSTVVHHAWRSPSLARLLSVPDRASRRSRSSRAAREWASASRSPSRRSAQNCDRLLSALPSAGLSRDARRRRPSACRSSCHMLGRSLWSDAVARSLGAAAVSAGGTSGVEGEWIAGAMELPTTHAGDGQYRFVRWAGRVGAGITGCIPLHGESPETEISIPTSLPCPARRGRSPLSMSDLRCMSSKRNYCLLGQAIGSILSEWPLPPSAPDASPLSS